MPKLTRKTLDAKLHAYERKLWEGALADNCGNVSRTARDLGITTQAAFKRVRSLKLKTAVQQARRSCAVKPRSR